MQATATITRKNVDTEKEEYALSYKITGSRDNAKLCKLIVEFNKAVVKAGGQTTLDTKDEESED